VIGVLGVVVVAMAAAAPLEGVVLERGTGDPVPGARVAVGDGSATTGASGRFSLEAGEGPHTLLVTGAAHAEIEMQIVLPLDRPLRIFVEPLEPAPEIVVEARVESPNVARQVLDRERVEKTPGTHEDPLRLVQALPGVVMTPEYSPNGGAISLRGASPGESRVLLDGVQIPYLYHFQQYASVVHTRLLDEVAVYPSAFSAEVGDATGGIVAVRSREPDPTRVHAGANVNSIMGGAFVQAPVSDAVAISGSARRSYLDLAESSNDQYTRWPMFWDYLSRVDLRPDPDHRYALTILGAGDVYGRFASDTALLNPVEAESAPSFLYERAFHGVILTARTLGERSEHDSVVGFTAEGWAGDLQVARQARDEYALTARHTSTLLITDATHLRFGADARGTQTSLLARTDRPWPELGAEAPLLARGQPVDAQVARVKGGAWFEPRLEYGRLRLQPGVRVTADSLVGDMALEPRLGARFEVNDDLRLRLAGGRYVQAPEPEALDATIGDPALGFARAWHAAAGVDWAIAGRWEVAVDGWGRRIEDGVMQAADSPPVAADGHAYGGEFTSRYRIRDRFFGWFAATFGHAELGGATAPFDQPFALSAVASWDFTQDWNVGARWRYAAGLPLTPVVGGVYDGDSDSTIPVPGAPFSDRLPPYQKFDLHLERELSFRRWTLALYAEGWWVPKPNNTLYRVYSYDYSQSADVQGPAFLPLLGARAEL
jgi:hypothetical protein